MLSRMCTRHTASPCALDVVVTKTQLLLLRNYWPIGVNKHLKNQQSYCELSMKGVLGEFERRSDQLCLVGSWRPHKSLASKNEKRFAK